MLKICRSQSYKLVWLFVHINQESWKMFLGSSFHRIRGKTVFATVHWLSDWVGIVFHNGIPIRFLTSGLWTKWTCSGFHQGGGDLVRLCFMLSWECWNTPVKRRRPLWFRWRLLCGYQNFQGKTWIFWIFFENFENEDFFINTSHNFQSKRQNMTSGVVCNYRVWMGTSVKVRLSYEMLDKNWLNMKMINWQSSI